MDGAWDWALSAALLLHLLRGLLASLGPLVLGRRPVRERRLAVGIAAAGADLPASPKLDKLEDWVAFPVVDGAAKSGARLLLRGLGRTRGRPSARRLKAQVGEGLPLAGMLPQRAWRVERYPLRSWEQLRWPCWGFPAALKLAGVALCEEVVV